MTIQLRRFQTLVGIAKETTWGTAVPATDVIPVTEFRENNQADVIRDQGLRGVPARDFNSQQGSTHAELTLGGLVMPEQIGWLLHNIMGTDGVTGAGPYVHTLAMAASPSPHTIEGQTSTAANDTIKYSGFRASKLTFNFEAATGAMAFTCEGSSIAGVLMTGTNPALPTYNNPWEGWRCTVASGTGAFVNRVISAEISLIRELQVLHTLRANQAPYMINAGPLAVEGKVTLTAPDYADYTTWLNHTTTSLVFTFTYGSAGTLRSIVFTLTSANLGNGPVELDRTQIGVTFALSFLGLYNATDVGPLGVVLTNSKTAVY